MSAKRTENGERRTEGQRATFRSLRTGLIGAISASSIAACGLSPIDHRIKLGEEAFVVFVGEGVDRNTDLFTTTTSGGPVFQLTFTKVIERAPALSHGGTMVAFLRMRDSLPATHRDVVVMNLESGAERIVPLTDGAGIPRQLGWGSGDSTLYIRSDQGLWQASMPPSGQNAVAVAAGDSTAANRQFRDWLGQPAYARVISCPASLCLIGPRLDTTALSDTGHDAMRWGKDSVAWFEGNDIVVRPLGPGRARHAQLKSGPSNPREGSMGGVDSH